MTQFDPADIKLPAEWPRQLDGLIRWALAYGGGYITAKGWLTGEQFVQIVGVAVPLGVLLWGRLATHLKHKELISAINAPAGQAKP